MPEEKLNSYRLTSMHEPTDALLDCIMQRAVDEANVRYELALERYFKEIDALIESSKAEWSKKYDMAFNA